jgi:hypothetical protein
MAALMMSASHFSLLAVLKNLASNSSKNAAEALTCAVTIAETNGVLLLASRSLIQVQGLITSISATFSKHNSK